MFAKWTRIKGGYFILKEKIFVKTKRSGVSQQVIYDS